MKSKGILFLSNGHGEDSINCQILQALRASGADVDVSAMPIVGDHEFQRWYPPRDLSRANQSKIENPQERAFIRGVASKI